MHRSNGRLFIGLGLLLLGAAFLLRNLNVFTWEFEHYYLGWPTLVFIIGLVITISSRGSFFGFSLMVVGAFFFLSRYYGYPVGEIFRNFWPVFLILFGLSIIFKRNGCGQNRHNKIHHEHKAKLNDERYNSFNERKYDTSRDEGTDYRSHYKNHNRCRSDEWVDYSEDTLDLTSMFGENKRKITSQNFKHAKITTMFGSTELDLYSAKLAPNCIIECDTVFGGTEIIVPSSWQVVNQSTAIFGGTDDKRRKSAPVEGEEQMKLIVKGFAMFGAIEIKS